MASNQDCDQYAIELAQRFEDFTKWALENWPVKDVPLLESDFSGSRKELQAILGEKLHQADQGENMSSEMQSRNDGSIQYVNINPAPWP